MKLYADTPGRRAAQIVADLLFVFWLVLWVWVGNQVHDTTMALAAPGRETAEANSYVALRPRWRSLLDGFVAVPGPAE